jgi:hypothetical protein
VTSSGELTLGLELVLPLKDNEDKDVEGDAKRNDDDRRCRTSRLRSISGAGEGTSLIRFPLSSIAVRFSILLISSAPFVAFIFTSL